jgi:phospholipid/cholesterol/gamma-HCH transport system ATP-binding protein
VVVSTVGEIAVERGEQAIELTRVTQSFESAPVLRGIDLRIARGELAGLIGPSGGGKSVLLKIIAGILRPTSGEVRDLRGRVSLMFQEGALFDSLDVFDNVAFPLVQGNVPSARLSRAVREETMDRVGAILSRVGLARAAHKMPAQLSGGMRRRVSLARALVTTPSVVLLDDPTAGLDPVASSVIMDLITELHSEYRPTMLIVSHDLRRLLPAVERIVALFQGIICFSGTLEELLRIESDGVRHFVECRFDAGRSTVEGDDQERVRDQ